MTERKLPPVGEWVPHDGGPCPVPSKSKVTVQWRKGAQGIWDAGFLGREWSEVVAFCVTEYPDEEETRTGRFEAYVCSDGIPEFFLPVSIAPGLPIGTCTTTIVNGRTKRIVWDADE
jgi:hypothetical protein